MKLPFLALPRWNPAIAFLVFLPVMFLTSAVNAADEELIANGNFQDGMSNWQMESGKGAIFGGHLVIISGPAGQGIVSQEISVKPDTVYKLKIDFRFEPGIDDAWSVGIVEVWPSGTPLDESDKSLRLGQMVFKTRKAQDNGYENAEWRSGEVSFNSGKNTQVILRLKSHPDSADQTHWNKISLKPE